MFHDCSCYLLCAYLLVRWKIITNNVPENLASVNIIQWVVQLRYSFSDVLLAYLLFSAINSFMEYNAATWVTPFMFLDMFISQKQKH